MSVCLNHCYYGTSRLVAEVPVPEGLVATVLS